MFSKENNICCCIFTIISSLLLGAGIAAVFFEGLVATILALLYVTLIFGLLTLIFVSFLFFCDRRNGSCFCINNSCLITTIIGSIISSIFALTLTTIASGSLATAFLIVVVAFFLISNLVNLAKVILCLFCTRKCD